MKLREQILFEHSKANCNRIVLWIGNRQDRFDELVELFLTGEYRVVQRAAWPLSYVAISHPGLVKKHFGKLVSNLEKPGIHPAVIRNTLRFLQDVEIPKKFQGKVMDLCFEYIVTPGQPVAIKAFALTVLENLSYSYPDILPEIKLVIEEQIPYETAAFKGRGLKILKRLG